MKSNINDMSTKSLNIKDLARRAAMMLLLALMTTAVSLAKDGLDGWGYQPVGQVESYSADHGSITVAGWGIDPNNRDFSVQISVILKQGDVEKYVFSRSNYIYRSNCGGNYTWRGNHGFSLTKEVDPGTYQLLVKIHNKSGTSGQDQYATFSDNTTEQTITIQPRRYTVNFHANYDGGVAPDAVTLPDNIVCSLPAMPSRPGYSFVTWEDASGNHYDRAINKNLELHAVWVHGTGTEDDPLRVSSQDDWWPVLILVNGNNGYYKSSNRYHVRLDTDLTLTTSCTLFRSPIFDGNGHTITINPTKDYWPGLFSYSIGGVFRNLTVKGAVPQNCSGYKYDGKQLFGGLIGYLNMGAADCIIENCEISVDLRNSSSEACYGGFIGTIQPLYWMDYYYDKPKPKIVIKNSVFNGSLSETSKNGGGFVGPMMGNVNLSRPELVLPQFENCFFVPKFVKTPPNNTFYDVCESASKLYYTEPGINLQGQQVYTDLSDMGGVYTVVQAPNGDKYYLSQSAVSISGLSATYAHTGSSIDLTYTVSKDNVPLAANAYTAIVRNADGEAVAALTEMGRYILEVTIDGVTYAHSFYVTGSLTQAGVTYQINNVADWITFADNVASGNTYSGYTLRLGADITTGVMIGTEEHPFSGTFDGNGHTLTLNYTSTATTYDASEDCRAPFRYINGATINNLTVVGATVSTGRKMGGLVGYAAGTNTISNCTVSTMLTSRIVGDCSNGGFIGHVQDGSTSFSRCVFNGSLIGTWQGSRCNGGFVGWSGGTLSFTDCLFNPANVTMIADESSTFARCSNITLSESYYTMAFGNVQGELVSMSPQDCIGEKKTMQNGTEIYVVRGTSIEGLAATCSYNGGAAISLGSVNVGHNGQTLTSSKYTFTVSNSAGEVVDAPTHAGQYTLTATGKSAEGYYGSLSQTFVVVTTLATDEDGYSLVASTDDWLSLDYYVKNGTFPTGGKVKLTADVSVSTTIGDSSHPFSGIFDGNGHTLTVSLSGDGTVAPFPFVDNATFINLRVMGTASAIDTETLVGGLVGDEDGARSGSGAVPVVFGAR